MPGVGKNAYPQCVALVLSFAIQIDVLYHLSHAACFLFRDAIPTMSNDTLKSTQTRKLENRTHLLILISHSTTNDFRKIINYLSLRVFSVAKQPHRL